MNDTKCYNCFQNKKDYIEINFDGDSFIFSEKTSIPASKILLDKKTASQMANDIKEWLTDDLLNIGE